LRAFIAIELDDEIRSELGRVRDRAAVRDRSVRWVAPASIHLTLKFLGEIDLVAVPNVTEAMARAARDIPPFSFAVRGFGCFPSVRNPRIFWAGVEAVGKGLQDLAANLEVEMAGLGFRREKRVFKPHLTLARIKGPIGRFPLENLERVGDIGEQDVAEIILFQSELKPTGAVYVPLATVPLSGHEST
jgi:2'-5' RNA ligase